MKYEWDPRPPFRVEFSVHLTDVFHQDLTPFVFKGAFFVWR